MSTDDSISYANSVTAQEDLDMDEIQPFEKYEFEGQSNKSNDLEIAEFKEKIIDTINSNNTVVISGANGCGKSTQVPQYILDDCISKKKHCNIIVTQPRRIAAISVSKQVKRERGWKDGHLVGYQVGRKRDCNPNTTKILYCTTGILLQKIIKAKSLSAFSHIILDEVHERTLEMDFLLLVIKKLIKNNIYSTRVILMSATADSSRLQDYFSDYYGHPHNRHVPAPLINIEKPSNYTILTHYLDDLYGLIPAAQRMDISEPQIDDAGFMTAIQLVIAFDEIKLDDSKKSVLIFLPGIYEIEEMYRRMEEVITSENHKWILISLHSSITSEEQDQIFKPAPLNYRKIILSTNIAESSITVPDVSFVIDFCLMKQLRNEMKSNYSMLVMSWASKSNCKQRSGRVGRVADGCVYRLICKAKFSDLEDYELPEMSRCSLSRAVLMSKLLDMGTPKQLLATALDVPCLANIILTINTLKQVGALLSTVNGVISSLDGDITYMGKVMAHLPLEPIMSKLIYFGYIFNILNEAIIMACGLSTKSIFMQPFNHRLDAYTQKLTWANDSCSDPITYINAYQSWLENKPEFDQSRHFEESWALKNFIQLSAIQELHDLIDDVSNRLNRNFGIVVKSGKITWISPEKKAMAYKVILAGAFYPNYFIRGRNNAYMDEHEVMQTLNNVHDPDRTVYFTGFPNDQPKELYKEAIESMFPQKLVGKPSAYFCTSNKVYVQFPRSNQFVPGNICDGVYVAIKMRSLKYNFKIPLSRPEDAKKKVDLITQQMAAQKISPKKVLPIEHSHTLKGPISPLEMSLRGLAKNCALQEICIISQSVNSVLLDHYPSDNHERLFVAGNVYINKNERCTLWDTTMMPNIPGMPAICCLMFSPCVEFRYNSSHTKMIGAICGLGYDPETSRPLFPENDIEITFDTVIDINLVNKINVIRMLLNRCVNPDDEEGPGVISQIQDNLQTTLMEILSQPTKSKGPELSYAREYMWSEIRNSRLQSPYHENNPVNHLMAGSDVYKLLWGTFLPQIMSATECKELIFKLSKINRLKERIRLIHWFSNDTYEELRCPLCDLVFATDVSVKMHFDNYQHIERYKLARQELHLNYTGPFQDIKDLLTD